MTKWIEALKAWNATHNSGKYCVPKKGSKEHAEVLAMMGKSSETPVEAAKKAFIRTKKEFEVHKAKTIEEGKKRKEIRGRLEKATAKKRILKAVLKRVMEKRSNPVFKFIEDVREMIGEEKSVKEIVSFWNSSMKKLELYAAEHMSSGELDDALGDVFDEVQEYKESF